jgi:hypothetical protein
MPVVNNYIFGIFFNFAYVNTNSAICQLYHGMNKLIFIMTTMMWSAL